MTQMTKLAPCKLKKLAQDLVKCWPGQSVKRVARKHRLKLRFISSEGIDRHVFLISGTNIVLKLSRYGHEQSKSELKRILRLKKKYGKSYTARYLPKIYLSGCIIQERTSVIAMRYYPKRVTEQDAETLETIFKSRTFTDFQHANARRTKSGQLKLIDLGV
jgi:hypothetical protein